MSSSKSQGEFVRLLYRGLKSLAFTWVSCHGREFTHLKLNVKNSGVYCQLVTEAPSNASERKRQLKAALWRQVGSTALWRCPYFFTDYRQNLKWQVYMRHVTSELVKLTEMNLTPRSLNIKKRVFSVLTTTWPRIIQVSQKILIINTSTCMNSYQILS